ncbi:TPA: LemA family protein [Patescibacteria group bacterium]|nr:LemA family protein [Candidatus Gracilibacteria bacterium]
MKTGWIIIIVVVLAFMGGCSSYNGLVNKEETVNAAWAQVQNVYQRRADLIPNLVSTVQGYADFEKGTLTAVIDARAKATSVNIDMSKATPEQFQEFESAQDGLKSSLARLMVVVEQYPDLKANQNFLELQAQLEGTENRITVERMKFNEVTKAYNKSLRSFPTVMFAKMFGFEKRPYFEATEGAQKAPEVKF